MAAALTPIRLRLRGVPLQRSSVTLLMALSVLLIGCDGASRGAEPLAETLALSPAVHVFKADLGGWAPNNGRWYSYVQSTGTCTSGQGFPISQISLPACFEWLSPSSGAAGNWVSSTGPWWIDPNHMHLPGGSGFGFINVLAFTPLPAGFRSGASLDNTVVSFTARIDAAFSTVTADSREGRRKGHVYLWFQTYARPISPCTPDPAIGEDCTRQSDYILTGNWDPAYEIDRITPGQAVDFSFALKASETERWTCLGRGFNVKYDCIGIEHALRSVAIVGFIIGPTTSCPTVIQPNGLPLCDAQRMAAAPGDYLNVGRFDVRAFAIRKAAARASSASRLAFSDRPIGSVTAQDGWSTPRYAAATQFAPGSGLHLIIDDLPGAVRLGVSHAEGTQRLDEAGYQIYISPAGTDPGQLDNVIYAVSRDDSGVFSKVQSFWPYQVGDTVGLYLDDGSLHFLKNDEVIFQVPSPCTDAVTCVLFPFISIFGGYPDSTRVYVY